MYLIDFDSQWKKSWPKKCQGIKKKCKMLYVAFEKLRNGEILQYNEFKLKPYTQLFQSIVNDIHPNYKSDFRRLLPSLA